MLICRFICTIYFPGFPGGLGLSRCLGPGASTDSDSDSDSVFPIRWPSSVKSVYMCMYLCVYLPVCTCVCTYVCTCLYLPVCTCVCTCLYVPVCTIFLPSVAACSSALSCVASLSNHPAVARELFSGLVGADCQEGL